MATHVLAEKFLLIYDKHFGDHNIFVSILSLKKKKDSQVILSCAL